MFGGDDDFVVVSDMVIHASNSGLEWGCCGFGVGGDDFVGDEEEEKKLL